MVPSEPEDPIPDPAQASPPSEPEDPTRDPAQASPPSGPEDPTRDPAQASLPSGPGDPIPDPAPSERGGRGRRRSSPPSARGGPDPDRRRRKRWACAQAVRVASRRRVLRPEVRWGRGAAREDRRRPESPARRVDVVPEDRGRPHARRAPSEAAVLAEGARGASEPPPQELRRPCRHARRGRTHRTWGNACAARSRASGARRDRTARSTKGTGLGSCSARVRVRAHDPATLPKPRRFLVTRERRPAPSRRLTPPTRSRSRDGARGSDVEPTLALRGGQSVVKLEPQPQSPVAFGFFHLNP